MEYNAFEFQNIDDYNKGIQLTEPLFNNINSIPYILFFSTAWHYWQNINVDINRFKWAELKGDNLWQ